MPKSRKRKLNRDAADVTDSVDAAPFDRRAAVRPGTFNLNGDFFTPEGVLLRRTKAEVTPSKATSLVRCRRQAAVHWQVRVADMDRRMEWRR